MVPVVLGLGRGGDGRLQHRDGLGVLFGLVQGLALDDQFFRLVRLGLGEVLVQVGQAFGVLLVLQLQLGQHQQRLVVAVVVQLVQRQRLLQVLFGTGVVIQVVGGLRSQLVGNGLVVIVGISGSDDFIGQRAGFLEFLLVVGGEQLVELAAHLGRSLALGIFTGCFREQHFRLLAATVATALATVGGTRLGHGVGHHHTTQGGGDEDRKHGLLMAAEDHGSPRWNRRGGRIRTIRKETEHANVAEII